MSGHTSLTPVSWSTSPYTFHRAETFQHTNVSALYSWLVQQKHHDRVPRSRTLNVTSLSSSHIVPTLKMEGWKLKIIISKQTIPLPPAFQPTSSCLACLGVSWPQLLLRVLTKHVSYLIALKTIAEHTPWNKAKIKLNPKQKKRKNKQPSQLLVPAKETIIPTISTNGEKPGMTVPCQCFSQGFFHVSEPRADSAAVVPPTPPTAVAVVWTQAWPVSGRPECSVPALKAPGWWPGRRFLRRWWGEVSSNFLRCGVIFCWVILFFV